MKISKRTAGIAGLVAGLAYLIQALMGLKTDAFSGASIYVLEAVFIIPLAAAVFALIGLHSFAQNHYRYSGRFGFWLAIIGSALMSISALATLFVEDNSPGEYFLAVVFLVCVALTMIGYILLGIMVVRGKVLPLVTGLALILGFPLSVLLSPSRGGVLFGLAWLSVGYYILTAD